jgi:hypothetical protein
VVCRVLLPSCLREVRIKGARNLGRRFREIWNSGWRSSGDDKLGMIAHCIPIQSFSTSLLRRKRADRKLHCCPRPRKCWNWKGDPRASQEPRILVPIIGDEHDRLISKRLECDSISCSADAVSSYDQEVDASLLAENLEPVAWLRDRTWSIILFSLNAAQL